MSTREVTVIDDAVVRLVVVGPATDAVISFACLRKPSAFEWACLLIALAPLFHVPVDVHIVLPNERTTPIFVAARDLTRGFQRQCIATLAGDVVIISHVLLANFGDFGPLPVYLTLWAEPLEHPLTGLHCPTKDNGDLFVRLVLISHCDE